MVPPARLSLITRLALAAALAFTALGVGCGSHEPLRGDARVPALQPLGLVIMDPLADRFSCRCTPPSHWRSYDAFTAAISTALDTPVQTIYAEDLADAVRRLEAPPGLIIGKDHAVKLMAERLQLPLEPAARLTDLEGVTTLRGLFIVRAADPAQSLSDLAGRRVLLGPETAEEKHAAAMRTLAAAGVHLPSPLRLVPTCPHAAMAVAEGEADAAVISSYAGPLLDSSSFVEPGSLRVIGSTAPVPFITVFVTPAVNPSARAKLVDALARTATDRQLRTALGSRDGFVILPG